MNAKTTNDESPHARRARWLWLWPAGLCGLVMLTAAAVLAVTIRDGDRTQVDFGKLLDDVGIKPREGAQVSLDVTLIDERGAAVRLSELNAGRLTILALVYYRCPML